MKPSLLIHFKSLSLAHRTSDPLILSGTLFQSPQSSCSHLCWGKQAFSSPHVSQCLTYIRKKNEFSTNPHPNSQTFLNPKQESQACDKKHYSSPHLSLIFLFSNFFFISFFLFAKIYQSKLMTFIIIYCVQKLQRYDLPFLCLSESKVSLL